MNIDKSNKISIDDLKQNQYHFLTIKIDILLCNYTISNSIFRFKWCKLHVILSNVLE